MFAGIHAGMGLGRVGEGKALVHCRAQLALFDEGPDGAHDLVRDQALEARGAFSSAGRLRSVDPVRVSRLDITVGRKMLVLAPPSTAIDTWRPSSAMHSMLRGT